MTQSPWPMRVSDPDARSAFRRHVESGATLVVPGASSALIARLIEEAGYPATYVTGAGIANTYLGMPDIGLLSLTELSAHVAAMRNVVDTPLIVDADTGFGDAVNTWHTVRVLERAGASAVQIEDQTFPKRCGHFAGKSTIPSEEMIEKVRAAVDARTDPNLLIVARTDARAEQGLAEACRRARAYRDAGADVTFVEAPESEEEIAVIAAEVPGPKVLNIVAGGRTPQLRPDRIAELGYAIALYANLPLVVSMHAVRELLDVLRSGDPGAKPPSVTWEQRQAAVRKPFFDELGDRYSPTVLAETPGR
jgi:2-methylisocitrate lyase-like PEP mutase family enzyme